MHGYHKNHPSYTYEKLYRLIDDFNPDFVGVEIRPEDMGAKKRYLQQYYPQEMIELSIQYGKYAFGFDWLGDDIAGQAIPENHLENNELLQLEQLLEKDDSFQSDELERLNKARMDIIKTATPNTLIGGQYGVLTRKVRRITEDMLRGSQYEPITHFNVQREQKINDNITRWLKQHLGKRIALVMGADHCTYVLENIKKQFGSQIKIIPIKT